MAAPTQADLAAGVPQGANITKRISLPGGGEYLLDANGGVYATGGADYVGSYWDDKYVGAQHRNDPNRRFNDIAYDPVTGQLEIVSEKGERYGLGKNARAAEIRDLAEKNSIYQDPAYLAFVRGADLTLEEAARQVARRQRSLNDTLALRLPELQAQNQQALSNIGGSYEARGVFRSGKRLEDQAKQEQQSAANVERMRGETAGQIAAEQESLAERVAAVQREATEKGFNTAQTQDLDKKIEGLRAKYPGQFAGSA